MFLANTYILDNLQGVYQDQESDRNRQGHFRGLLSGNEPGFLFTVARATHLQNRR